LAAEWMGAFQYGYSCSRLLEQQPAYQQSYPLLSIQPPSMSCLLQGAWGKSVAQTRVKSACWLDQPEHLSPVLLWPSRMLEAWLPCRAGLPAYDSRLAYPACRCRVCARWTRRRSLGSLLALARVVRAGSCAAS